MFITKISMHKTSVFLKNQCNATGLLNDEITYILNPGVSCCPSAADKSKRVKDVHVRK